MECNVCVNDWYIKKQKKDVKEEDRRDYTATKIGLDVRNIKQISDESWHSRSFVITIPASQLQTGQDAEWPSGIHVRRFFRKSSFPKDMADNNDNNVK